MTQTLKSKTVDTTYPLMAQGVVSLSNPAEFSGGKLTGSCDCCSQYQDPPADASGYVDMDETRTYGGTVTAHWWAFPAEMGGGVTFYEPTLTVTGTNMGVEVNFHPDAGSGWTYDVKLTAGDAYQEWLAEPITGTPADEDVDVTISCPVRMFMYAQALPRTNTTGTLWGPRGNNADECIDLRQYMSGDIGWYYWPPDGTGNITVEMFGKTYSLNGDGPPVGPVGAFEASAQYMNFGAGEGEESYLEADLFDCVEYSSANGTDWHVPDADGAYSWVSGHRISIKAVGTDPNSVRMATLTLDRMEPAQTLTVDAIAYQGDGTDWADETFQVNVANGPSYTSGDLYYGVDTTVNTEFPIGTAISIASPGTWEGTGTCYKYVSSCWSGAPGSIDYLYPFGVDGGAADTIHDAVSGYPPALGFTYDAADLDSEGQQGDAWRFPLVPGVDACSWAQFKIHQDKTRKIETFTGSSTGWSPGASTSLELAGGYLRIYGAGSPLIAQVTYSAKSLHTFRSLKLVFVSSEPRTCTCTETGSSKEWEFTLSGTGLPEDVYLDLCCPSNASGDDDTSTVYEVDGQGGWGWGVDDGAVLKFEFSGEVRLKGVYGYQPGGRGYCLVAEGIQRDARWLVDDDPVNVYAHDILTYAPDGRIAIQEECGRVAEGTPDTIHSLQTLQSLYEQSKSRTGTTRSCWIENLKPAVGGISMYDGFWFCAADHMFNARGWAYLLREGVHWLPQTTQAGGEDPEPLTLYADYQVDRVKCWAGISLTFTCRRVIGGMIAGIVQDGAGNAVEDESISATAGGHDTMTTATHSNGVYTLPDGEQLDVETTYTITPSDGTTHAEHGQIVRLCMLDS